MYTHTMESARFRDVPSQIGVNSILHVHEVHVPHLILNSAHFSTITEFWRGLSLCDGVSF